MNKLKKIGISALAGTLVSLSAAQAGGVSVSGNMELSYVNLNHEKVTGQKLGMNKNLSFGSSGDVTDGGGVTWTSTVVMGDTANLSSASMSLNMGGIATLAYDSGTGGYGANAVDNVVPTAWEEIDYGLSTGIVDVGAVSASNGVINLTIKAPVAGTAISLSYVSRVGGAHIADGGNDAAATGGRGLDAVIDLVNYSSAHFGMRLGFAAETEIKELTCDNQRSSADTMSNSSCNTGFKNNPYAGTAYTTLALGPIHMGVQATFNDPQEAASTGMANRRAVVAGAALVVGDTLSISYGKGWQKNKYNNAMRGTSYAGRQNVGGMGLSGEKGPNQYEDITYRGWSAAINLGPVALKATRNAVDEMGENGSSSPKKHSEINLSMAF